MRQSWLCVSGPGFESARGRLFEPHCKREGNQQHHNDDDQEGGALLNAPAVAQESQQHYALSQWQPVVPIAFDPRRLEETVKEFGQVVNAIEDGRFVPPSLEKLQEHKAGMRNIRFGTYVCRNCDARFSCVSYRQYAWLGGKKAADRAILQYLQEAMTDAEQEA